MPLKKSVTTLTLLTSAIAGIIGSGWLLGPLACVRIAGPAASLTWLIAGILMMFIAASFILLTRALPVVGGTVKFFQLTYGQFAGFSFSWVAWLAWLAVSPIETMALIQYSANYLPSLMTHGVSPVLSTMGVFVAIGVMALITFINNYGLAIYNKVNRIILAFKLLIPIATVILLMSKHFNVQNLVSGGQFMPYGWSSVFAALPLAGVIYSFIGFNPAIQLAAETKNPRRSIPIAIFGSLIICIILYTLIQLSFIAALPANSLAHGWKALTFAGDNGPFAGLLAGLGFIWFVKALYVDAAISPFGTALVQAYSTGRLTYAMSENQYFPSWLQFVNKHNSPSRAMLLNMVIGFAFFLPFPSWQHMVGFLVSCLIIGYVTGPMSLMIVCQKADKSVIPYPPWLVKCLCLIAFYICNLMIFWSGWSIMSRVAIIFGIGYGVLAIKIFFTNHPRQQIRDMHVLRGSWVLVYIVGMAIISALGHFGGNQRIAFGPDFAVMAIFTLMIFILAHWLAKYTAQP